MAYGFNDDKSKYAISAVDIEHQSAGTDPDGLSASEVADVLTLSGDVYVWHVDYHQRGEIATLGIGIKAKTAISSGSEVLIGTLVSDKMPVAEMDNATVLATGNGLYIGDNGALMFYKGNGNTSAGTMIGIHRINYML